MVFVRRAGSTLLLWAIVSAIFASMFPAAYLGLIGVLTVISTIEYFRMLRTADVKCFPRFGLILALALCGQAGAQDLEAQQRDNALWGELRLVQSAGVLVPSWPCG